MAAFCAVMLAVSAASCDNGGTPDPVDTEEETGTTPTGGNDPAGELQDLAGTVSITGTARVGETLTADTSGLTNAAGTLHYQWVTHGNDWEAATDVNVGNDAATYIPQTADAGKYISVTVSSSGNTGSVKSNTGTYGSGSIGRIAAVSLNSLAAVLAALGDTSAGSPATVPLSGLDISENWASINTTVSEGGKYVILDLSACEATGDAVTSANGLSPTGNDMAVIKNNIYLKGIILPDTLASIGANAFYECTNLTSVVIKGSNVVIARQAFYGCTALTSVSIPAGATFTPSSNPTTYKTFYGCTALATVILGDGITIPNSDDAAKDPFPLYNASLVSAYAAGGAGTYTLSGTEWTKQ